MICKNMVRLTAKKHVPLAVHFPFNPSPQLLQLFGTVQPSNATAVAATNLLLETLMETFPTTCALLSGRYIVHTGDEREEQQMEKMHPAPPTYEASQREHMGTVLENAEQLSSFGTILFFVVVCFWHIFGSLH